MTEEKKEYKIEGRESTIFRVIHDKNNPYVVIDQRPVTNPRMSFKAKGILTYLLTRPDGWEVNVPDLVNHSTDGAAAIRTGLRELAEAGHVKYNVQREGGYIKKWVIEVYEVPSTENQQSYFENVNDEANSALDSDFQQVENQQVENRGEVLNEFNELKESSSKGKPASISPYIKAEVMICNAAEWGAIPSKFREHLETVLQMIDAHGEKDTASALKESCKHWKETKRINGGGKYSPLNPGWIDWAIAHLAGETPWANEETADDAAHPEFKKWIPPDITPAPPPKEKPSFMKGKS